MNLINYDHRYSERTDHHYGNKFGYNPQYPFDFGLSYATFGYSDLQLTTGTITPGDSVVITVNVKDSGEIDGS